MDDEDQAAYKANQTPFQILQSDPEQFEIENDWSYSMRRSMQEIVPGVYLGPYAAATKKMLPNLQENGITHIVCVRHPLQEKTVKPNFPEIFQYLTIDLAENLSRNVLPIFAQVKEFVDRCLLAGGKALIHGNTGISASATLAIAYVMETYGLRSNEAFHVVQQKRFCINPNESFKRQLMEYEALYLARHQTSLTDTSKGLKRSRDEIDKELSAESPSKKFS